VDQRGFQVAERHSSQNGQHGGPSMPMFCVIIGATGLMLAALTVLTAGQMATSHRTTGQVVVASAGSGMPPRPDGLSSNLQPPAHGTRP